MVSSEEKQVMHNISNKGNTSEESRTFHNFPLGGPAPSALPGSKSNHAGNLHWSSETTESGLGVVEDLPRATDDNKNSLVSPLVIGQHDPSLSPDGAHSKGLCSKLGKFLLQSFGTRVPKGVEPSQEISGDQTTKSSGNRNRFPSDDPNYNPRKKAKISEDADVKEESFMSYCFGCHKRLKENEDIYIYRGEMAFCSTECREREILIEEKKRKEASSSSK